MSNKDQGKDYYADLSDDGPAQREITVNGKSKTVWFRRVTAGERVKLNSGMRFKTMGQGKQESTVDMADFIKRQHQLVAYSNVKEDGTKVFRTPEQVSDLSSEIFDALLKCAQEVNGEDSNEGKDLPPTANSDSS